MMKKLNVFTGRVSDWRRWQQTDVLFLDVTLLSGDLVFAPTGDILWPYKRGEISDQTYTEQFDKLLYNRMCIDERPWHWLINQEAVCLACYCSSGKFCHRHLLKRPIRYQCEKHDIMFIDQGEILW